MDHHHQPPDDERLQSRALTEEAALDGAKKTAERNDENVMADKMQRGRPGLYGALYPVETLGCGSISLGSLAANRIPLSMPPASERALSGRKSHI